MSAEKIRRYDWKRIAIAAGIVTKLASFAMYVGDSIDFKSNFTTPLFDKITGVETQEGFANRQQLDLISRVNENGNRESYLSYNGRESPINSKGYALPPGASELMYRLLGETTIGASQNDMDRFSEDLEMGLRHYVSTLESPR